MNFLHRIFIEPNDKCHGTIIPNAMCMKNVYKLEDGTLKAWSECSQEEWTEESIFAVKQDVKLLGENILVKGVNSLKNAIEKHGVTPKDITYYLPHVSSYYFRERLYEEMIK